MIEGNPRPGVRLEIRDCESLSVVDNVIPGWTLDALNERDSAPPSMKIRTTDAQGRFEFTGLPVDCRFWIDFRAKDFPWRWVYAATTGGPQPDHDGAPVLTGDFKVTLGDAAGRADQDGVRRHRRAGPQGRGASGRGSREYSGNDRRPGPRHLEAPAGKVPDGELAGPRDSLSRDRGGTRGGDEPAGRARRGHRCARPASSKSPSWTRRPAQESPTSTCGSRPIPNGRRERLDFRSWEVATRIAWRESPRTDARGKLRALVEPGKHRIGVGLESYPRNHEVVETSGQDVECRPGETVQLKFTMRKRH